MQAGPAKSDLPSLELLLLWQQTTLLPNMKEMIEGR